MNILLIGGNGFIGSHLIDHLLLHKHKIRVFDVAYEKYRKPLNNVDYRIAELNNIADLYESMIGIDLVIHLASSSVPSTSNIDIITDVKRNIIPTLNILNLMVKQGIKKIIYFSSGGAVYGNSDSALLNESHPLNPISSYGIIKVSLENYIKLYNAQYDLDYLILRPSNPYGPRQGHFNAQGVISTFLKRLSLNTPLTVFGDGSSTKDYIFIEDLIQKTYGLISKNASGIFNIGSGVGTSLNKIIELAKTVSNLDVKVNYIDQKKYDVIQFVLDITKVNSFLADNNFTTTIELGMKKTWDWINFSYSILPNT